ncbi:hypothetical protein BCR34DRAFT_249433 [Clohesyomyces aquaticus]|uniref:Uncharacterized protein n=1 Tax=Clohesyomyces aquaticus TaxID=1231657 RepID=A0A1Y1ZUP1_9PLEO|nr:hypothetical protein BCR34DRAFT_249433 [Clohesyomyces aquaticus]
MPTISCLSSYSDTYLLIFHSYAGGLGSTSWRCGSCYTLSTKMGLKIGLLRVLAVLPGCTSCHSRGVAECKRRTHSEFPRICSSRTLFRCACPSRFAFSKSRTIASHCTLNSAFNFREPLRPSDSRPPVTSQHAPLKYKKGPSCASFPRINSFSRRFSILPVHFHQFLVQVLSTLSFAEPFKAYLISTFRSIRQIPSP